MIPNEAIPLLSALIIGAANFASILLAYYRMERRIDKKIQKYWNLIKGSEEGQDLFTLVKEAKNLVKGEETQKLFKEAYEILADFRDLVKKIKERMEASTSEEEDTEPMPVLPSLVSKEEKA